MDAFVRQNSRHPAVRGADFVRALSRFGCCGVLPVKRHRGSRDTRGTHGRTQAHGSHRRTSQPSKPINTPARPYRVRYFYRTPDELCFPLDGLEYLFFTQCIRNQRFQFFYLK